MEYTVAPHDLDEVRHYRLSRVRAELEHRDYAGILLYDPVNTRYATDTTNMQLWAKLHETNYAIAHEQIAHNLALLKPGISLVIHRQLAHGRINDAGDAVDIAPGLVVVEVGQHHDGHFIGQVARNEQAEAL